MKSEMLSPMLDAGQGAAPSFEFYRKRAERNSHFARRSFTVPHEPARSKNKSGTDGS
jgi:hypothetical protein